ncbi:MAG: poly(3-hydroxybutyrate) depolymerase [Planctomycetota bacterium]|nr:MAG: poly(3-hydroxybutyrate) depolymerase [Planctomycetota bacterium]
MEPEKTELTKTRSKPAAHSPRRRSPRYHTSPKRHWRPVSLSLIGAAVLLASAAACAGPLPPTPVPPGDYERTLTHDGRERTYRLHVPPTYDGRRAAAVVFMFHGGFGSARQAARDYGWIEKSDAEGFLAVFPQGVGRASTWNAMHCCGAALREDVDDVGFVVAILGALRNELWIDERRVYATGMSNGAMFCHRLAAERSDLFAAIAPVAGAIGGRRSESAAEALPPQPSRPMPVIMFHGRRDQHVLYDGGRTVKGAVVGRIDIGAEQGARFWADANGHTGEPRRESLFGGRVERIQWPQQGRKAEVVLYAVRDLGHAWPGGRKPWRGADDPNAVIDATDMIWEFFKTRRR